jgi:biotin transport system substrate-specific component
MIAKAEASTSQNGTLYEFLTPSRQFGLGRAALTVLIGTALLWLSAKISVPFYPVPMTLQPLAVLLIGAALGPRLAGATVATYLLEGAAGLPVFAGGGGIVYLVGPTGGYLAGFFLATLAVGTLTRRGWDRNVATMALAMAIGVALIYIPGVLWLGNVIGWNKPLLALGLTPFLYGDAVKIILGACLMPAVWHVVRSRAAKQQT